MKRIIGLAIYILTAATLAAGCFFPLGRSIGQTTGKPGGTPAVVQHWVTKAISNDGLKKYSGDLEIYLNDDGSAFVRFRDYNVQYYSADRGDEYQTDEGGELYNEYGLFYTWRETLGTVTFQPMDAESYYVTDGNEIHSNNVKNDSRQFAVGRGRLRGDGTMELAFAFSYVFEDGWRDPKEDYFILEQTDDLAGAQRPVARGEAEGELASIQQAMRDTDSFCRALAAESPAHIARFYAYNNYEQTHGSFWFALTRANILYDGEALFAITDTTLYPEYADGGGATLGYAAAETPKDIEVFRNGETPYALLYEPGRRPADAVVETFLNMDGRSRAQDADATGALLDGYPIEVSEDRLYELGRILEEHGIQGWREAYEPAQMATDGDGYFLATQYGDRYFSSGGYMAYPDDYAQAHEALVAFFGEMRAERDALAAQQRTQAQVENVAGFRLINYAYGDFLDPDVTHAYKIERTDDGLLLSYGNYEEWFAENIPMDAAAEQEIVGIYQRHGAFSWNGYDMHEEGRTDFVFMNDIFVDDTGLGFNFIASGIGHAPEGHAAFREELTTYLDAYLQWGKVS